MGNLINPKRIVIAMTAFVLGSVISFAQVSVTGVITDENGGPMIGASVVEQGTTPVNGVVTDLDGTYTIKVAGPESVLVISCIGYSDFTVTVGGRNQINAQLEPDALLLDQTVVTAMGITKSEKSLSYNVQQLALETINPTGTFVNSLNGKVAGVTINQSSTGVGGSSRVVMRGAKSISGNNNALYVVDGIPMPNLQSGQPDGIYAGAGMSGDGLASINPDDIETISVLSGPSAAALYGSAAANGVVLITTKKGAKDSFEINYANTTMFSQAYMMPSFQNIYGPTEQGSYQSWGDKLATPSTWNPRDYFRTGLNENNSISISAGNGRNQTYFSAAANVADGIVQSNNFSRFNFTFRNTTSFLKDKLTLDINANYAIVNEQNMIAQGEYSNPVVPVYLFPAGNDWNQIMIYERFNGERNMKTQYWPYANEHNMQNPYWISERQKFDNDKHRLMASVALKYQPFKWLNITGRAKIDNNSEVHSKMFNASTYNLFAGENGFYSKNSNNTTQSYAEILANVNKYFVNDKLNLTATVGANVENIEYGQNVFEGSLASVANLFTYANIEQNGSKTNFSESGYHKNKQAVFANIQIGWDSMVYLDFTARNDWSSTLAASDYKSFFYPTAGISIIPTEILKVLQTGDILNYWKLRVSYSEVGNDPDVFLTIPTYPISKGSPVTTTRMPNTNLQPERTKSLEFGTNIHLFKNKLKIDATYYRSSTYNQFLESALSASSQYTSVIVNAGQVDNRGIELSASFSQDIGKIGNWTTYFTYSHNQNTVVSLLKDWHVEATGETISINTLDVGGMTGVKNMLTEGGSMGDIYVRGLMTDEHGAVYVHPQSNQIYVDQNNWIYAGDTTPKHNLSWGNDFSIAGVTFGFLFTARLGGVVVSKTQQVLDYYGISQNSADARLAGGAMVNGYRLPAQAFYQTVGADNGATSLYVYSADNIRLAEVSLGYTIPLYKWVKWIKSINISAQANNVAMLLCKAPFDPEMTANTGTYNQGIDYFMQPSTRSCGFSVKVKF